MSSCRRRAIQLVPQALGLLSARSNAAPSVVQFSLLSQQFPLAWASSRKAFSSSPACLWAAFSSASIQDARSAIPEAVLQQVSVGRLREELEDQAANKVYIPYSEFEARAKSNSAASTDKEVEELCSALQRAGIVLRHGNIVYLKAGDIAEMVMMMLPGAREETEARLAAVDAELSHLEAVHQKAELQSERITSLIMTAGAVVLFTQLVAFIYLTWWELSWDVMEPFGYIIQLFYSFIAYLYFLSTRGKVFDLGPFREFWSSRIKARKIEELKFDQERYEYLLKLRDRYRRHLAHRAATTR